jgi:hypothetical protein
VQNSPVERCRRAGRSTASEGIQDTEVTQRSPAVGESGRRERFHNVLWTRLTPWAGQKGRRMGCLLALRAGLAPVFDIGHWVGGGVTGRRRYASA